MSLKILPDVFICVGKVHRAENHWYGLAIGGWFFGLLQIEVRP